LSGLIFLKQGNDDIDPRPAPPADFVVESVPASRAGGHG